MEAQVKHWTERREKELEKEIEDLHQELDVVRWVRRLLEKEKSK